MNTTHFLLFIDMFATQCKAVKSFFLNAMQDNNQLSIVLFAPD